MAKSTVYFTNELTPEAVVKMYRQLGIELPGKVAVKVHSGEDGNQNYLHPEFMKPPIPLRTGFLFLYFGIHKRNTADYWHRMYLF